MKSILNTNSKYVRAVLVGLKIRKSDADLAFMANERGNVLRRDPSQSIMRARITAGLRYASVGGVTLSYPDIAELVGIDRAAHSTAITRAKRCERLGLLTAADKSNIMRAIRGKA